MNIWQDRDEIVFQAINYHVDIKLNKWAHICRDREGVEIK